MNDITTKPPNLDDALLAAIRSLGGAVKLEAIARLLPVEFIMLRNRQLSAAMRRLAKEQRVYCIKRRYWKIWD